MKRFALFAAATLLLGLLALGQFGPAPARAQADDKKLANQAMKALEQTCARCHGVGTKLGGLDVRDYKFLMAERKDRRGRIKTYVVARDLKKSLLWQRIEDGSMPAEGELSEGNKDLIKKWIEAGAPAPAAAVQVKRAFVSTRAMLEAIRDHLRAADHEDRPYLRYFTLVHLHNNPKIDDVTLARYRAALSKALNSLHWKKQIVIPRPIDKNSTIFVVDLRDLNWDRKVIDHKLEKIDRWTALLYRYPYGLSYKGTEDEGLENIDKEINRLTQYNLVHMRADWFVAVGLRPPLYETVLRLPQTAGELEKKLDVDVIANFKRNRLARAGSTESGVSKQNRLVERHDALYGSYWKSYDFLPGAEKADLLQFPLGPESLAVGFRGKFPYKHVAFKHDGGEMIFHLPNGLMGYFLTNGKDEYIPAGPIEVVSDELKTSGTNIIVNGLSCMRCHARGVHPLPTESVRNGTAVGGDARRKVKRLYPTRDVMDQWVADDQELFLAALKKATAPFLADSKDEPIDGKGEPISYLAIRYYNPDITLERAAFELGYEDPKELKAAIKSNRELRNIGLAPLVNGGVVKLSLWQEHDGSSLFQKAASELGIGTPRSAR